LSAVLCGSLDEAPHNGFKAVPYSSRAVGLWYAIGCFRHHQWPDPYWLDDGYATVIPVQPTALFTVAEPHLYTSHNPVCARLVDRVALLSKTHWRQGAEAFGRNYGDAFAERVSFQTARFVTGAIAREDPRYVPSTSHNIFSRSVHAVSFSFVDRSDSGHRMPALSTFVGAAAGGFVGNTYLPTGFNDVTHAGQRATLRFGFAAGGNLFREFAPQMPGPVRNLIMLIAR
jgi:hypothetical protein